MDYRRRIVPRVPGLEVIRSLPQSSPMQGVSSPPQQSGNSEWSLIDDYRKGKVQKCL